MSCLFEMQCHALLYCWALTTIFDFGCLKIVLASNSSDDMRLQWFKVCLHSKSWAKSNIIPMKSCAKHHWKDWLRFNAIYFSAAIANGQFIYLSSSKQTICVRFVWICSDKVDNLTGFRQQFTQFVHITKEQMQQIIHNYRPEKCCSNSNL